MEEKSARLRIFYSYIITYNFYIISTLRKCKFTRSIFVIF